MELGLMFFATDTRSARGLPYDLMLDVARIGDREGFCCVWTPERHFDPFGGLFPNPAITSAALAAVTSRIQLRAGSSISPLHDVVRLAEDWSMVDNLSGGRVAVSFGSGWNVNDFVFFPERYATRQEVMLRQIAEMKRLWRGESVTRVNSFGHPVAVTLQPAPIQRELPVWITSSGNPKTFAAAGALGANVLTHLIGQDEQALAAKIAAYRAARGAAGHAPESGIVSLMLHTYVAETDAQARTARAPLVRYLRAAAALERNAARGGGTISGGRTLPAPGTPDEDDVTDELLDLTCDRYIGGASLIGSIETCGSRLERLASIGVDEIACLLDFGVPDDQIRAALAPLATLRARHEAVAPTSSPAVRPQRALQQP